MTEPFRYRFQDKDGTSLSLEIVRGEPGTMTFRISGLSATQRENALKECGELGTMLHLEVKKDAAKKESPNESSMTFIIPPGQYDKAPVVAQVLQGGGFIGQDDQGRNVVHDLTDKMDMAGFFPKQLPVQEIGMALKQHLHDPVEVAFDTGKSPRPVSAPDTPVISRIV